MKDEARAPAGEWDRDGECLLYGDEKVAECLNATSDSGIGWAIRLAAMLNERERLREQVAGLSKLATGRATDSHLSAEAASEDGLESDARYFDGMGVAFTEVARHCERIAKQSELLGKRAEKSG